MDNICLTFTQFYIELTRIIFETVLLQYALEMQNQISIKVIPTSLGERFSRFFYFSY